MYAQLIRPVYQYQVTITEPVWFCYSAKGHFYLHRYLMPFTDMRA